MSPKIKLMLDLGPLLVFFLAYRFAGLLAATGALIVFTLFSLAVIYAHEKRIAPMPLMTAVAVTFFGGLTLFFHDEQFIKMKPTMVNLLFAGILLGVALFYGAAGYSRIRGRRLWPVLILVLLTGTLMAGVGLIGTEWLPPFEFLNDVRDAFPLPGGVPEQVVKRVAASLAPWADLSTRTNWAGHWPGSCLSPPVVCLGPRAGATAGAPWLLRC